MNQANQPNPFIQFIADYRNHPTKFVEEILGIKPDPWQSDLLEAIAKSGALCPAVPWIETFAVGVVVPTPKLVPLKTKFASEVIAVLPAFM